MRICTERISRASKDPCATLRLKTWSSSQMPLRSRWAICSRARLTRQQRTLFAGIRNLGGRLERRPTENPDNEVLPALTSQHLLQLRLQNRFPWALRRARNPPFYIRASSIQYCVLVLTHVGASDKTRARTSPVQCQPAGLT